MRLIVGELRNYRMFIELMYSDGRSLDEPCDDWRDLDLCSRWIGLKSELWNSEYLLNWCNIHCEMNESSVSIRDGKWVEEPIWPLKFVRVELWVFCLSRCNSMKGQFSGPVRWTRVRSLFMMWSSWRTHMTHSWWVEKLLNVCRVDVTLWKVSVKWMSL